MADDKTKRDFRDRNRVSADEDYELSYLADKMGVDKDAVRAAINAVGNDRHKLESYIQEQRPA
ncbi:DUF3606 domain-containing protein [Dyadobacter sandarakinus]|uniref:DUF3606 domain-containing protein n=1 Tax=Dyadobacter sandarakinus TaxID=2747268 RepID=A0ABX7I301_9BACT|nr:DUF3606 domain-containing protein [Dyadobacter sandarakinus]QRR00103.1 DUF3606 domain-containing protein [Dyadobacter sandarakinus]